MTNCVEMRNRFADFLEAIGDEYKFDVPMSDEGRVIMDEICDFAEEKELFRHNEEAAHELDDMTAYETYKHMLNKIVGTPFSFMQNACIILLLPLIRRKMIAEGIYKVKKECPKIKPCEDCPYSVNDDLPFGEISIGCKFWS